MSGKMSPIHDSPWLKAFDDSIQCYVKTEQNGRTYGEAESSLRRTIEIQDAELRSLRSKLLQNERGGGASPGFWFDLIDLFSAAIWLVGCVCFLPVFVDFLAWGCLFFMIGEWGYIAIGLGLFREALRGSGCCSSGAWEGIGCALGGASFFIGTILFLPERLDVPAPMESMVTTIKAFFVGSSWLLNLPGDAVDQIEKADATFEGAIFFITGSICFSMSSFCCALGLHSFIGRVNRFALLSAILHMGGGLLFCIGSVGFISQVGCGSRLVAFGSWSFMVGCLLFISGAFAGLCRFSAGTRPIAADYKLDPYREPLIGRDTQTASSAKSCAPITML